MQEREVADKVAFEMAVLDAKKEVDALAKLVTVMQRTIGESTPSSGLVVPYGSLDDARKNLSNLQALSIYLRGRKDSAEAKGLY